MITLNNVSLERYFEPVFEPVSFQLRAGETLMVTGTNGSGKTTLMRIIAGLLDPGTGTVSLPECPIAYIGHYLGLKDNLSVRENLQFSACFSGHTQSMDIESALSRMQIARHSDQAARQLSAGQRKRCALARLLYQENALWLLDEPYANLDTAGMSLVDNLLREHSARGGLSVVASHNRLVPDDLNAQSLEVIPGGDRHA